MCKDSKNLEKIWCFAKDNVILQSIQIIKVL